MIDEQRGIAEAEQYVETVGIDSLPVRPSAIVKTLCNDQFTVQMETKPFSSAIMGVAKGNRQAAVIFLNENIPDPGRFNFTAAHEIGHVCMHIMPELKPEFSCGESEVFSAHDNPHEKQANGFASGLLMPRALISPLTDGEVTWANINVVKTACETSLQATYRRMSALSKTPTALVLHQHGKFKLFVRSDNFDYFIARTPLTPRQLENVVDGLSGEFPTSLEEVDAIDWGSARGKGVRLRTLYASSIGLKEGFVYTLLSYDDDCLEEEGSE